jgi:tripartite-type tricarboxylate transporter receptor subunit TctC
VARLIAQGLTESLKQPVVVENRGGNVVFSAEAVAKAPPDGYTLLIYAATLWVAPLLAPLPYDALRDFAPITLATQAPNMLVVHPSVPAKSVKEFVALARAKPGMLNYGGSTTGSTTHLAVELLKSMTHIDLVRVPYKGQGPMFTALMAGEIQLTITSGAALLPHVKSGRMRALGVTSARPSALFPDMPTVAAAVPGYESQTVFVAFAPAATPPAIVNLLHQELARTLSRPEVKERCMAAGTRSSRARRAKRRRRSRPTWKECAGWSGKPHTRGVTRLKQSDICGPHGAGIPGRGSAGGHAGGVRGRDEERHQEVGQGDGRSQPADELTCLRTRRKVILAKARIQCALLSYLSPQRGKGIPPPRE